MMSSGSISGKGEQGNACILIIMIGLVLSILSHMLIATVATEFQKCRRMEEKLAAFNLAEAGIEKVIHELKGGNSAYSGEKNMPLGRGSINVELQAMEDKIIVISTGFIPNQRNARVKERIRVSLNATDLTPLLTEISSL